ncbi:hypothetical protein Esti_004394 [Eimeria stiedai]
MGQNCVRAGLPSSRESREGGGPPSPDEGAPSLAAEEDTSRALCYALGRSSTSSSPLLLQQQLLRETLSGGSRKWRVASPSLVYCLINRKAARHAAVVFDCRAPQGPPSFRWGGAPGRGPLKLHYAVCPWRGEEDVLRALEDFNAEPPLALVSHQPRPPVSRSAAANPAARSSGFVWPRMRLQTLKRLRSSLKQQQSQQQQQQQGDKTKKQHEEDGELQRLERSATMVGCSPTAAAAAAAASDSAAAVAASNSSHTPHSHPASELLDEGHAKSVMVIAIGDGDDDPLLLQFLRYLQNSETQYTETVVLAGGIKSLIPRYSLLFLDSDILLPGPTEIIAPDTQLGLGFCTCCWLQVVVSLMGSQQHPQGLRGFKPQALQDLGCKTISVPFSPERKHYPYAEAAHHVLEAHKQNIPVLVFDTCGEIFAPGVAASFLVLSGFGVIKALSHIKRKADYAKVGVEGLAEEAISEYVEAVGLEQGRESLQILIKVLGNVSQQPHAEKYRRLKLDNPRLKESVTCHKPLLRILRLSGFTGAPGASELVLPPDASLSRLQACLAALQRQQQQ